MYNKETLAAINGIQPSEISQSVVDWANEVKKAIENKPETPSIGDSIEYTDEYGTYYQNAHIETLNEHSQICLQPFVPFVFMKEGQISFSTSGGPWDVIPENMVYKRKKSKAFKVWRSLLFGESKNGCECIYADVNAWEYKHPNPLYGSYSTKEYNRNYFIKDDNRFTSFGIEFSANEFKDWLATFRGKEFTTPHGSVVVFSYKRIEKLISKAAYNGLVLPRDTRYCNGVIEVKVQYCDTTKTVTEYRCTNKGDSNRKPYELARKQAKNGL